MTLRAAPLERDNRSSAECVFRLFGAGIEALVLAGAVIAPVLFEVAVADHCAEGEDGFGAVQAPSGPSDVEAVGDEVPAGSLDDAGGDGPAFCEGLVVAQVLVPGVQVAGAGVGSGSPARGQAGGAGLGGDLLR